MKLIAGQEKGLTVFLHLNWHTCNRANPFQGFSAVSPYNRRIRDPYVRWCERRTPSVSGGAVYSVVFSYFFSFCPSAWAKTYSFAIFGGALAGANCKCVWLLAWALFFPFVFCFVTTTSNFLCNCVIISK